MARTATDKPTFGSASVLLAFVAGALSVLIFQFGFAALLYAADLSPNPPWRMTPVPPFGVPQTLNAMFWGGLWGIVMLPVLAKAGSGAGYWLTAMVFGALAVSTVLFFVVFPIKGRPVGAGWDMKVWARVLAQHAAFGLGTAVFLRLLSGPGRAA